MRSSLVTLGNVLGYHRLIAFLLFTATIWQEHRAKQQIQDDWREEFDSSFDFKPSVLDPLNHGLDCETLQEQRDDNLQQ